VVELTREADAHRVVGRAELDHVHAGHRQERFQRPPGPLRQVSARVDEVGHAVIAEDKRQPLVGIPAVEVDGLREIAIAPQTARGGSRPASRRRWPCPPACKTNVKASPGAQSPLPRRAAARKASRRATASFLFFLTDILSGAYRSRLSQRLMRAELLKASARYGAG